MVGGPPTPIGPKSKFLLVLGAEGENPWDAWGPEQDVNSTRLMKTVLGDEKPDYVFVSFVLLDGEMNDSRLVQSFEWRFGDWGKYVTKALSVQFLY
jgi:hypothetical protein